jgi:hypothetical protein
MNNQIEITYISAPKTETYNTLFLFCKKMNDFLTGLKLCHLFTNNYNMHKIYGDTYDQLSSIFDNFQEELIGLFQNKTFSNENFINSFEFKVLEKENNNYIEEYSQLKCNLINLLTSKELQGIINSSESSGLNNTLEEIFSKINKTDYFLKMLSF